MKVTPSMSLSNFKVIVSYSWLKRSFFKREEPDSTETSTEQSASTATRSKFTLAGGGLIEFKFQIRTFPDVVPAYNIL